MENILPIIKEEIKKFKEVFKIIGFSEEKSDEHFQELIDLIVLNITVNLLSKKGYRSKDGKVDVQEIGDFIKNKYSPKEIKNVVKEIVNKTTKKYFLPFLENVSEDKLKEIKKLFKQKILSSI